MQLRLADFKFEHAETLQEIQDHHAEFVETFNTTPHWAHRERDDGHRSPVQVLQWIQGHAVGQARLRRLFGEVKLSRTVNRYGFVSVQRFYVYAEQGLSRQRVSICIFEGQLHIDYQETLLAKYLCDYDQRKQRPQAISHPVLYETAFASPQLELFQLDDAQWLKVRERSHFDRVQRITQNVQQLPLSGLSISATVVFCLLSDSIYDVLGRICG